MRRIILVLAPLLTLSSFAQQGGYTQYGNTPLYRRGCQFARYGDQVACN